jgi:hypothetical protein
VKLAPPAVTLEDVGQADAVLDRVGLADRLVLLAPGESADLAD